jgi:hypothetical protein
MTPFIRFSVVLRTTVLLLDYGTNGSTFSKTTLWPSIRICFRDCWPTTTVIKKLIGYAGVGPEMFMVCLGICAKGCEVMQATRLEIY